MTGATLFAGFEGAGLGMTAAGINHLWGIELDPAIAAVSQANGFNTIVANILDCDPDDYAGTAINYLHASPPCPSFSVANTNGSETVLDIALAQKTADFITVLLPDFFTLENVFGYRLSKSWEIIARALLTAGYSLNYWHICTADWGVPQTRRRMIVIARRDGIRPQLPPATHAEKPQAGLFGSLLPWVGWYEAIADLIPGLPESTFADWQLKRLTAELKDAFMIGGGNTQKENPTSKARDVFAPAFSVAANTKTGDVRAFILTQDYDDSNTNDDRQVQVRRGDGPVTTIRASETASINLRAFIVDGKLSTSGDEKLLQILDGSSPAATAVASESAMRDSRAHVAGRVVQMTTRCLARFQSFPDSYRLSGNRNLDCRGIGNAVPPLFMQRVYEALINGG